MQINRTSVLARIRKQALARLIEKYTNEMDPDLPCGINPPPGSELDDISRYDGTAGYDRRPDFVREDDERIGV